MTSRAGTNKPTGRGPRVAEALLFICVFCRADLEHRKRAACAPVPRTMGACRGAKQTRIQAFSLLKNPREAVQDLLQAAGFRQRRCGARDCDCLYTTTL